MFDLVVLSTNLQVGRLNIVVFSEATIRRGSGKYCRKTLVLESLLKHAKQVFYCEFCNILNPFQQMLHFCIPWKHKKPGYTQEYRSGTSVEMS